MLRTSNQPDTMKSIHEVKASAFEFCQQMQMNKKQAISFTILALKEKGYTGIEAFEAVVGEGTWGTISCDDEEKMLDAVTSAFFD